MWFSGLLQSLTISAALAASANGKCTDVEVPVTVKAVPVSFPEQVNLATLKNYFSLNLGYLLNTVSGGEFTIRGSYCTSGVESAENNGRLQVLVHGILGSRYYWSGLNPPGFEQFQGSNYSYVDYALSKGYDTFAIDRLGNAGSSRPNPFTIHLPAQVEAVNSLLTEVRAGALGAPPKEIIWVGHSWGSILGSGLVAKYPQALERLVLTGWTAFVSKSSITAMRALRPWPAARAEPKRFGELPLGYLHPTNKIGSEPLNFWAEKGIRGHHYDALIPRRIGQTLGTVSVSELLSPGLFNGVPAPDFKGQVLVVTGQHDEFFCAQSYLPGHADCGTGGTGGKGGSWGDVKGDETYLGKTGPKVFPNAGRYDYFVPPHTGHGVQVHYSQRQSFDVTTEWLSETHSSAGASSAAAQAEDKVAHDEL